MESVIIEKRKTSYSAEGEVLVSRSDYDTSREIFFVKERYPTKKFFGETKEDLISQIKKSLKDNSLIENQNCGEWISSQMQIHTYETLTINGKEYLNKSTEYLYFENE